MEWILTDPATNQYGRKISPYKFEFKEDKRRNAIIDLERYTWKEIADCCESYYPSMGRLFAEYGDSSVWIMAECLFEMNIIKS